MENQDGAFQDDLAARIQGSPFLRKDEAIWRLYMAWVRNRSLALRQAIERRLDAVAERERWMEMQDPFHPSPLDELAADADFVLPATIIPTGGKLGMKTQWIEGHVLVIASSNAGKTTIALHWAKALLELDKSGS